jgi:hypothetical protein
MAHTFAALVMGVVVAGCGDIPGAHPDGPIWYLDNQSDSEVLVVGDGTVTGVLSPGSDAWMIGPEKGVGPFTVKGYRFFEFQGDVRASHWTRQEGVSGRVGELLFCAVVPTDALESEDAPLHITANQSAGIFDEPGDPCPGSG